MSSHKYNKLYAQYRNKPKMFAWSEIPRQLSDDIIDASDDIENSYDIDNNSGAQLDVIGNVVVKDRSYIATLDLTVYECNGDGDFECGDDSIQCSVTNASDDDTLSDEYYRLLLKAKIAKNSSDGTIDSILTAVNTIAPDIEVLRLTNGEDMSFSIEFYGIADDITRDLLINGDIVPTPEGVKFNGFLAGYNMVECNINGDFECGDDTAECTGFIGV